MQYLSICEEHAEGPQDQSTHEGTKHKAPWKTGSQALKSVVGICCTRSMSYRAVIHGFM